MCIRDSFTDLPAPHPLYLNMAQPTWNTYPGGTTSAPTYAPEPGAPTYQTPYQQTPPTYSGTVVPTSQGPLSSLNPKTPVSYTHLDVYKRQLNHRPASSSDSLRRAINVR